MSLRNPTIECVRNVTVVQRINSLRHHYTMMDAPESVHAVILRDDDRQCFQTVVYANGEIAEIFEYPFTMGGIWVARDWLTPGKRDF